MKYLIRTIAVCAVLGATINLNAQTTVGVDPSAAWIGYMNVFDLPSNGGGYEFGSTWGTADLNATFSGPTLTLTPNTSIDRDVPLDTYWWQDASGTSPGNKTMDASMYVQNDALAGQTVTFTGDVLQNTLVSPYTSVAFIKDFNAGYGLVASITVALTPGVFSFSLATTPGDHIQYGFETIGPDARLATIATLGNAEIIAVPEPSTIALAGLGGALVLSLIRRRN
ncbi:MAG: PEP-CTERM sorting domain-containing protein [Limisphaerales bacterium]